MAKMTIEAAARQSEKNAQLRREAEEFVAAQARNAQPEEAKMSTPKSTKPVAKPAKVAKSKPLCGCGCGERTGGGIFCPGHDAKLKSQLFAAARGSDKGAAAAALTELDKRGWTWLMAKAKPAAARKMTRVEAEFAAEDDAAWTALLDDIGLAGLTV